MLKKLTQKIFDFGHIALERFGLDHFRDNVIFRRVAKTPWYQGDGATLILLLSVQVLTGVVLTLSYSNAPDSAFSSLVHITHHQFLGWFVRGLHYWSSGLMIIMLLFHVFRLIMIGGFKAPREGTWITGVFLFFLIWIMAYSGYTLRWNEQGIYALKVFFNILYKVPFIGADLVRLVQGGEEITALTLSRMYSLHVIFVPALILAIVGVHMYLVILHGVTSLAEREVKVKTASQQKKIYDKTAQSKEKGEDFYPVTMATSGTMAFIVFLVGVILTLTLGPPDLGFEANLIRDAFPQEEWWFAWYSSVLAILPGKAVSLFVVWFPILIFFFLLLLPFLDRGPNRGMSKRPGWVALMTLSTIILIGLNAYRVRSPWTAWPIQESISLPHKDIMTVEQLDGFDMFKKYGCISCHGVAGQGAKFAVDVTGINRLMSKREIEGYILSPPTNIAMPSYKGRLSTNELRKIVEFVHVFQIQPADQ